MATCMAAYGTVCELCACSCPFCVILRDAARKCPMCQPRVGAVAPVPQPNPVTTNLGEAEHVAPAIKQCNESAMERTDTVVVTMSDSSDSIPLTDQIADVCTPIERHGALPSFPKWIPNIAWAGNNPDSIRQPPLAQGLPNPALKKK